MTQATSDNEAAFGSISSLPLLSSSFWSEVGLLPVSVSSMGQMNMFKICRIQKDRGQKTHQFDTPLKSIKHSTVRVKFFNKFWNNLQ